MQTTRPNPDTLLAAIQKQDARQQRGKLKIFLGMAAGVGKTYAMLEAARQSKAEGIDVVVGYVETHKRAETEALLAGLEVIARRKVDYRDTVLEEMDLDAILTRRPHLVLVDELAHSNAPGSRHRKRHQDVLELLEVGINVFTTINVQHFESRADAVRQITFITIHDTVPDSIVDAANEIELIDLAPDELRKRLAEGKVYTVEKAETAADNFFRVGNLTALREMALRLTAEHVDHQLQDYMQVKHITGPWKSGERLMVAISASPSAEQLIRWTRRMAYNLEGVWFGVHVETAQPLTATQQATLAQHFALVRQLGGEVILTQGDDVSEALLHVAHQRNSTQLVVGKPKQINWLAWWQGGSIVDRLIRQSGEIDIYVVACEGSTSASTGSETLAKRLHSLSAAWVSTSHWMHYVWALAAVAIVTAINLFLLPWFSYQVVGLTELFAVFLIALYGGRGPALLAAAVSALSWNYLFIPPRYTFAISEAEDLLLFGLYFLLALFTGNLTARIRTQEKQARFNADRSMALYKLAHETSAAASLDDVLHTAVTQVGQVFAADIVILLPDSVSRLGQPHASSTLLLDEKEFAVATWVFDHGRPAGRFTDSLPSSNATYLPLLASGKTVGVLGIRTSQSHPLLVEQETLLETFTNQIALVIQREVLDEAAQQAALLGESERLYTTLLNSISHELRTPLATITGAASTLIDPQTQTNPIACHELTSEIQSAAERLNRLVENLLDMSRLDSGRVQLKLEWCDVSDVVSVALKRLAVDLAQRTVRIDYPPKLPLIQMDFVLMEQVLVNLIDNACSYTPAGSQLVIAAKVEDAHLLLSVSDAGPGVASAELERIFDKFYRIPGTATGGTGLGLSICRGLVEAHGGTLRAEPITSGGTRFAIRLPMRSYPPPVEEAKL